MVVPGPDLARTYLIFIRPLKLRTACAAAEIHVQWVVIALVLLAAFGPVLWLLPSANDRRLTKLRGRARSLGLELELTRLPDLSAAPAEHVTAGGRRREPTVLVTAYRLPSVRKLGRAPTWRLRRGDAAGPLPGWQWDSTPAGSAAYWTKLATPLARVPADALGCAAQPHAVCCFWRETTAADDTDAILDSLFGVLQEMLEIQRIEDEMIRAAEAAADADEGA
jgi:hypothetical protein